MHQINKQINCSAHSQQRGCWVEISELLKEAVLWDIVRKRNVCGDAYVRKSREGASERSHREETLVKGANSRLIFFQLDANWAGISLTSCFLWDLLDSRNFLGIFFYSRWFIINSVWSRWRRRQTTENIQVVPQIKRTLMHLRLKKCSINTSNNIIRLMTALNWDTCALFFKLNEQLVSFLFSDEVNTQPGICRCNCCTCVLCPRYGNTAK